MQLLGCSQLANFERNCQCVPGNTNAPYCLQRSISKIHSDIRNIYIRIYLEPYSYVDDWHHPRLVHF